MILVESWSTPLLESKNIVKFGSIRSENRPDEIDEGRLKAVKRKEKDDLTNPLTRINKLKKGN